MYMCMYRINHPEKPKEVQSEVLPCFSPISWAVPSSFSMLFPVIFCHTWHADLPPVAVPCWDTFPASADMLTSLQTKKLHGQVYDVYDLPHTALWHIVSHDILWHLMVTSLSTHSAECLDKSVEVPEADRGPSWYHTMVFHMALMGFNGVYYGFIWF